MKRFTFHLDALIVVVALFALSLGGNFYLWKQNEALFKEKVEALWQAQNMESSWKYARGQLDECRSGVVADSSPSPLQR
ncbi:hypothetical protein [Endothiovibrio diazotrophicus]